MIVSIENQGFGYFEVVIAQCDREDVIELANCLSTSNSPFLQQLRLVIESELMEVR